MTERAANDERLARLRSTLTLLGLVAYVLLGAELAASMWGRWRLVAGLALITVFCALLNVGLNQLAFRLGLWTERLRAAANLAAILSICHLSGWSFQGLAMIILIGAAHGGSSAPEIVELTAAVSIVSGLIAAADGAGWLTAATLATAVQGAFWLVYGSARVGSDLLEQLDERHRELAIAHTQLRKMQQVALHQEKLASLGMMASGIAHEINNPMAFITSNVTMLLEDLSVAPNLPAGLKDYVDEILPETVDGIRRVNSIVSDLRRFARGDASAGTESYDLNQQVEHALRIAHNQLKPRCKVVRDLGALPPLQGRPQQMAQVVVNLLVNAAQAIATEGTVTVTTRQTGDEATLTVRDTGSGMTAETLTHLFEPFYSTKPAGEGTGLGLAVIHGIVKEHGGHVDVESERGKGSSFTLHLPLPPDKVARSGAAQEATAEPALAALRLQGTS